MPLIATRGAASAQGFGEFAQTTAPVYIEDVFSTYLYTGNGSTQTITNNIDLSGKGGLVWIKNRSLQDFGNTRAHWLFDSARTAGYGLFTNSTSAQSSAFGGLIPFSTMPLLLRGFYAYEDTKTPVVINLFATGFMMVLAVVAENFVSFRYVTVALAIALGVSNIIGTLLSIRSLEKRVGRFPKRQLLMTHFKLLLISAFALIPSYLIFEVIRRGFGESWLCNALGLALSGLAFAITYIYVGKIAKVEEITSLYRQVKGRFRPSAE